MHSRYSFPVSFALLAATTLVQAETVLEEVVVSGFRQQAMLETSHNVTLLDADTIRAASLAHSEELLPLVPNLNFSGEGSRARYLQIRGVGELEQNEGAPNPSVGFFIDDMDLSGIGGVAASFDLDRIEVLRGPQSVRFGASALAGVIWQQSALPEEQRSARAELSLGDDHQFAAGAALGGSLAPSLRGRISAFRLGGDGFRENVYLDRATSERDELTVRGKLAWDFAADWTALFTGLRADFDNGYDAFSVRNDDRMQSDHPGQDAQQTLAGSLRIEGPINSAMQLESISAATSSDVLFSYDGDWGNPDFWQGYGDYVYDYRYRNPRERDSLSQELRLVSTPAGRWFGGRTDWVIGLFARRLEERNEISSTGIYDDSGAEGWCTPCLTGRHIDSDYTADSMALFGGTESQLTERVDLSVGLRLESWDASYADDWFDINYPLPEGGTSCSEFDCEPDEQLWGGHLALGYALRDSSRVYLRAARGYKAGGFNPSLAALQSVALLGPEYIQYGSETLWNFELGLKAGSTDGRLMADVSLFVMDRDEAQLSRSSQQVPFDPNSFVYVTWNGAARARGLESSLTWQLHERWELHAALGLLDSEVKDSATTRAVSPEAIGRELAHAPRWSLNLGASYVDHHGWFGRLDLNAADDFYFDLSHDGQADQRTLLNLRLGKQWGPWSLAAWIKNLTDESWQTRGFWFGNEPPYFENRLYTRFGDPRTLGLTLAWQSES